MPMKALQYWLLNEHVTTALGSSLTWYLLLEGLFTAGILPIAKKLKHQETVFQIHYDTFLHTFQQ